MAIIRGPRPDNNFYLLDKQISEDKRLSWAARGLLIYLLGKPDHWTVSPAALVNETKHCAKPSGRDSTYGLLRELVTVGYLRRTQNKKDGGLFDSVDYIVTESAQPLPDSPHTDLPHTAQPHTANPTQVSIEEKQGLTGSKDSDPSGDAHASPGAGRKRVGKKSASSNEPAPSAAAWDAYKDAYAKRYGIEPLRNAKVNTALKSIASQVGADRAPSVVAHYLKLGGFYAECQHDITILVRDLQKVWNDLHRATGSATYQKPVTAADFQAKDYRRGINADGTF
ncbi:hypothetical protein WK57_30435 [Burkholderia ubonensis]|uniref:Helix-turn-helix domain-containing protein n=1 Tax=Burkholderia ubonensis TaxID=101571 RepID=A0AA40UUS5_9BURK|nr:hypothetical protein [Burkholderia ubonensis]KVN92555.1 hypothetical protein WJ68_33575 [Burkholderia ubonensis]KWZ53308.1 hypothetical protein WK57_30435 [Burkholderia ubonensis]